jgi:hypothetical protein
MQGLAAANANSAPPFTTVGASNRSVRGGAVIADHFFAREGNVPLLTVKRRVPVVAARGNVSGFVCWHIGEHSLPTSGADAVDGEIAVLGADQPHRHRQAQRTAIVIGERHQTVPRMEAAGWQLLARCRSLCRRLVFPPVGEHRKLALRLDSAQMTRTSPNQRGA